MFLFDFYTNMFHNMNLFVTHVDAHFARIQMSRFSLDSVYSVEPPKVSAGSRQVYEEFVRRGARGRGRSEREDT